MNSKYYLTFNFECGDDMVYECDFIKTIFFDTKKPALVVGVSPKIRYINGNMELYSSHAILTHKYQDQDILNYNNEYMPTIVYVAFLKNERVGCYEKLETLKADMLINWAVGEVYDNYNDALNHRYNLFKN